MTILIIATFAFYANGSSISKAIFGEDNRRDIFESPEKIQRFSTALATWVSPYFMEDKPSGFDLIFPTLKEEYQMCADENFVSQPTTMISCTAFLVADDLMLTAGHCMVNIGTAQNELTPMCSDFNWVFDYQVDFEGQDILTNRPKQTKVKCVNVIKAVHEEINGQRIDYALFRIDTKMPKRYQFKPSSMGVSKGSAVEILGYPSGLPLKHSAGAFVLKANTKLPYFEANIDSVGGNSGSPVFGSTGNLYGILVRGNDDFTTDPILGCDRWNQCSADGKNCDDGFQDEDYDSGMHIQKITPEIAALIKKHR